MDEHESSNHSQWECLYHVVFIPKGRRKTLYVGLRQYLGEVFRRLAEQKQSRAEEGYLMLDHVHMLLKIPPQVLPGSDGDCHTSVPAGSPRTAPPGSLRAAWGCSNPWDPAREPATTIR